jgi:hypothetical protein
MLMFALHTEHRGDAQFNNAPQNYKVISCGHAAVRSYSQLQLQLQLPLWAVGSCAVLLGFIVYIVRVQGWWWMRLPASAICACPDCCYCFCKCEYYGLRSAEYQSSMQHNA